MNRLCELAGVSRAGYYRFRRRRPPGADRMDLRNEIQQIALHWPAYGYRRIHGELVRGGWTNPTFSSITLLAFHGMPSFYMPLGSLHTVRNAPGLFCQRSARSVPRAHLHPYPCSIGVLLCGRP